ncbi:MAG: hypothetical protein LBD96_01000 [Treponema sp.]|nr:hypothetical protein [Treponema sp.]
MVERKIRRGRFSSKTGGTINGQTFSPGTGKNKKSAEQETARIAYEYYGRSEERGSWYCRIQ